MRSFVDHLNAYSRTMPKGCPPLAVGHPSYGIIGSCVPERGFVFPRKRFASTRAILRDHNRRTVRGLRFIEDHFPKIVSAGLFSLLARDSHMLPYVLGAISTYDGIVAARGSATTAQDVWMAMTATIGSVTLSWYDCTFQGAWTPGSAPSVTAYTNAGTGGAVLDATSNGSWLTNPGGTNKKYVVSCGLTTPNITGFSLAMLIDNLWAGQYVVTSNTTINPTTDIAVTRWAGSAAVGNMMMCTLASTYTFSTTTVTVTTQYTGAGGSTGQTTISVYPASGPLINRVMCNTLHNSATIVASTPFMPLTNGNQNGIRNLEQVTIANGSSVTAGTVNHKIVRPLLMMPFIAANSYIEQDTTLNIGNMVELVNASQVCGCINWLVFTGGTTATTMSSFLRMVEG